MSARRTLLAAAVASLIVLLSNVPAPIGQGAVKLPTLDWFYEGKTLEYRTTNGSSEAILNVTIAEKNNSNLTWDFWSTAANGSKLDLNYRFNRENRSDLNLTNFFTYLWVNKSNVDDGVGETIQIGSGTYDLTSITTEHYVFENDTRTLKYDVEKGWLEVADLSGDERAELIGDRDINPDDIDGSNVFAIHGFGGHRTEALARAEITEQFPSSCNVESEYSATAEPIAFDIGGRYTAAGGGSHIMKQNISSNYPLGAHVSAESTDRVDDENNVTVTVWAYAKANSDVDRKMVSEAEDSVTC